MTEFDQARNHINLLQSSIQDIESLISEKKKEHQNIIHEINDAENDLDEYLSEKAELEEILNNCSVDVCKYKEAFEQIKLKSIGKMEKRIRNKNFHFFLCYRELYGSQKGQKVIDSHKSVIKSKGFCWWAKFFREKDNNDKYQSLEPFGESISVTGAHSVAESIYNKVQKHIQNKSPVYLFLCDPNPPQTQLHVANVIDYWFGNQGIPYQTDLDYSPPICAYIPEYLFHKREGNCISCSSFNSQTCNLRFSSNFWFKIDQIVELENISDEFNNLVNCFSNDSINFAIPILYPLLVTQKTDKYYFSDHIELIPSSTDFYVKIPSKEKGHTKTEKVNKFFKDLNTACNNTFVRAELIDCARTFSSKPEIQKTDIGDEINIFLPEEYRIDGKTSQYKIILEKVTKTEQKLKAIEMIKVFIK